MYPFLVPREPSPSIVGRTRMIMNCLSVVSQAFQLLARGVQQGLARNPPEDLQAAESFLLRTRGAQIADAISRFLAPQHDIEYAVIEGGAPDQPAISLEQRNLLKKNLPKGVGEGRFNLRRYRRFNRDQSIVTIVLACGGDVRRNDHDHLRD
jgi:hypothetical protein